MLLLVTKMGKNTGGVNWEWAAAKVLVQIWVCDIY
jgi:hypothetical protein